MTDESTDAFSALRAELAAWSQAGKMARLWLRDDDAMAPTPALDRLLALSARHAMPVLLAAIPMRAEADLPDQLGSARLVDVAMHGIWHRNHAPHGEKSQETHPARGLGAVAADLGEARRRLVGMFGASAGRWYVPPWNRIAPEVAGLLPALGFQALSTFAQTRHDVAGLAELNCHVDLIDWRGGRTGRAPSWVAGELAAALARSRLGAGAAVGLLAHHLDHDATAWSALDGIGALVTSHNAARWVTADEALG